MRSIPFSPVVLPLSISAREDATLFFGSSSGKELLEFLAAGRPGHLLRGDAIEVAAAAGAAEGYEQVFRQLWNALVPPQRLPAQPEAFPSLDDDAKWPDRVQ